MLNSGVLTSAAPVPSARKCRFCVVLDLAHAILSSKISLKFCAAAEPDSLVRINGRGDYFMVHKSLPWYTSHPVHAAKGVQFMKTPDYVQAAGSVDLSKINTKIGYFGGGTHSAEPVSTQCADRAIVDRAYKSDRTRSVAIKNNFKRII